MKLVAWPARLAGGRGVDGPVAGEVARFLGLSEQSHDGHGDGHDGTDAAHRDGQGAPGRRGRGVFEGGG